MYDCIKEKSTEAAAETVRRVTGQIWRDREMDAQRTAEREGHESGQSVEQQLRTGWSARARAIGTRGPVIWTVYETPDHKRHWLLAPPTLEMQTDNPTEAEQARAHGDLVVGPDDTIQDIIDKLEAARDIRASSRV